ncbi:MAG: GNAT family N-acetyltransferase [Ruminococcaceae bacterium]|nr:GNAT family N-acetyltransferase [Oscillospiraceae bacterium]
MSQLIMRWKNDHTSVSPIEVPSNCKIVNFTELNSAIDKWLDIVQYGLSDGKKEPDYYHNTMTALSFYNEDKCFFILENEKAVATITVVCDYDKKVGLIHMVACREDARGKGYGTLLTKIAEYTLKKEGMESAYLTTDDWRIPAIKSYLRIGFYPDLSNDDFINRWDLIYKQIRR